MVPSSSTVTASLLRVWFPQCGQNTFSMRLVILKYINNGIEYENNNDNNNNKIIIMINNNCDNKNNNDNNNDNNNYSNNNNNN